MGPKVRRYTDVFSVVMTRSVCGFFDFHRLRREDEALLHCSQSTQSNHCDHRTVTASRLEHTESVERDEVRENRRARRSWALRCHGRVTERVLLGARSRCHALWLRLLPVFPPLTRLPGQPGLRLEMVSTPIVSSAHQPGPTCLAFARDGS